jgi:hypothetical protein
MVEKRGNRRDRRRCPAACGLLVDGARTLDVEGRRRSGAAISGWRSSAAPGWGWPGGPRKFGRAGTPKEACFEEAEIGVCWCAFVVLAEVPAAAKN